jgi:ABC-type molybdenum transport system ATPase subunit/photorepair protein PhrA
MRQGNSQVSGLKVVYYMDQDRADSGGRREDQSSGDSFSRGAEEPGARGCHAEMSLLKAVSVVKCYGGRRVVDGINLEVRGSEVVGLLGPNGAAKLPLFTCS